MTDWGQLYRNHVDAVSALVGDLDTDALATTVPGTPAWTGHDVLGPCSLSCSTGTGRPWWRCTGG